TATSTQRPPLHNGHLYTTATSTQRPPLHNDHLYTTATSTQRPPLHNGHLYATATSTQRPPLRNGHLYTTATSTNGHLYATATSTQRLQNPEWSPPVPVPDYHEKKKSPPASPIPRARMVTSCSCAGLPRKKEIASCQPDTTRQIRKYLTADSTKTLIHAFVTSHIDYCNSLLYGLPQYQFDRLQRVLNAVARVTCLIPKYPHISPVLAQLHWLPVRYRVTYKIALIVFKALNGLTPKYVADMLTVKPPGRYLLRSDSRLLLTTPKTRSKTLGDRAFSHAAQLFGITFHWRLDKAIPLNNLKPE
ncbi:hypothetical protein QZH41_008835, partial [Actinostola sp. cb2023]